MVFPTYDHKLNPRKNQNNIMEILFSLCLSLLIILASIKFTLVFKPLYYFDIQHLNIEHKSSYSRSEIIKNYDYIISYFSNPKEQEFKLPSIPYSKYGQIHFKEVKNIFSVIDILLVLTGIISIIGLLPFIRRKKFYFLKLTSYILLLPPTTLLIIFMMNFNTAFVIFHKKFFSNDYWEFDPKLDPVINILPQQFFLHAALLIVILLFINSIVLKLLYKKLTKYNA